MNTFKSFDGIQIAYHDEGEGPAVILLHGFGVDGLGQFGDFERILPILEKRQEMFRKVFGGAPALPDPPLEGRPGMVRARNQAARFAVSDTNVRGGTFFKRPFHSCINVTKLYKINTPREVDRSASETATAYWQIIGAT